jgi:CubicO group peptidase (beta-lactamase class C family)
MKLGSLSVLPLLAVSWMPTPGISNSTVPGSLTILPPTQSDAGPRYPFAELEAQIREAIEQREMPGFAIAIVKDRKVIYAKGFGVRNLDRKDDPVTERSLFHMASVTKPFVATSVMQLWEKGKVDLDPPLARYLPYFRLKDERYKTITVRQMLRHISGMPDVQDYEWDKPQYDDGALERYVRSLGDRSLIAEPGTVFRYSNMAYEVLGDLIAKISGETFEGYVQTHILKPLGMKSSTLLVKEADKSLLTSPHVVGRDYETVVSKVFPYNRAHSPSSTLYSNVLDMSRWAMANINRGELDGKRILKASSYDLMWKPDEKFKQIGISWFLGDHRGHRMVLHAGGDVGFRSYIAILPEDSIAVVLMSNSTQAPVQQLTKAGLDTALGLKPGPLGLKASIGRMLYKTIMTDGIEGVARRYYDLKKQQPNDFDFGEAELNVLGYNLLGQNRVKEAIRMFQLNVEAYPQSSNVYDSLGEGYMVGGDKTLAIDNYEKSLKLDANNTNAVEMLKRLRNR